MKAIQIVPAGGYDSLTLAEVPEPATAAGEALVRVTAAGVTPFDHSVLTGKRPVANNGGGREDDAVDIIVGRARPTPIPVRSIVPRRPET